MKKLAITIAIVLGLGMTTIAAPGNGGLFKRGITDEEYYGLGGYGYFNSGRMGLRNQQEPEIPNHGLFEDGDADAPLGAGIVLLMGLGGAYLVAKKRKEE